MERKMQDCYFYYYSKCTKGEHCGFRHEPSALGVETTCKFWQEGKCTNMQCNLRHMELKKNRKSIPCYWENQPSGCQKPHCPFLHKASRNPPIPPPSDNNDCAVANSASSGARNCEQGGVEPLVVTFQGGMQMF